MASLDRYGRYLIVPSEGGESVPHTRATTWASTLEDRFALERWGRRTMALGLARRPDLVASVAAAKDDDRRRLDRLCEDALEAGGSSRGANIGSALHEFCARIDGGEDVDVPAPWDADIRAYRKVLDEAGFEVELVERTVVVDRLQVAGTLDRTVCRNGRRFIADIKTGKDLSYGWPAIACQLAIYSRADTLYDTKAGTHSSMPEVDQTIGIVIHVPAGQGKAELFGVDLNVGWQGALLAGQVRQWRKDNFRIGLERSENAVFCRRSWLVQRIGSLVAEYPDAAAVVAQRWPIGVPTLKQSDEHTIDQLDAIVVVLDEVEGAFGLPFGELDPTRNINNKERETT
jgi:hypothetical protein